MKRCILVALSVALVSAGCASSGRPTGEHRVTLSETPADVEAAIKAAARGATITSVKREVENGLTLYEAEYAVDEVNHSVTVSASGEVIEEEKEIKLDALPAAVTSAVMAKYSRGEMDEAYMVKARDREYYEVCIEVDDQDRELKIDSAGTILDDQVEDDDAHDEDEDDES